MANRDKRLEYTGVVIPVLKLLNNTPGCKVINIPGSVYMERGTPDILGSIRGRTIAFECKRDFSEAPENIQEWRLSEWKAAGSITGCVHDVSDVVKILHENGIDI